MPAREPQFLAEASLLLSRSLEPDEAMASLARRAVPAIADELLVHLRHGSDATLVVHEVADPSTREDEATAPAAVMRVLAGGASELHSDSHRSTMVVPLLGRGEVLGTLSFVAARSGRRYGPESLSIAEDLGRRAGLAIENARLFAAEHEARQAAERAANGLERLYRLTLALASVVHAREVAATFVEAGC